MYELRETHRRLACAEKVSSVLTLVTHLAAVVAEDAKRRKKVDIVVEKGCICCGKVEYQGLSSFEETSKGVKKNNDWRYVRDIKPSRYS